MDDQYRLSDFGLVQEEGHNHPPVPFIQRKTLHIPGKKGVWDFGTEIREKHFNIPLATQGRNLTELQHQLNQFVEFLYDEYGEPRLFKLVFDYEPDKFYLVKVSTQFEVERLKPFSRFVLPLVANYPYKQFIAESNEVIWDSDIPIISDITWLYGLDDFVIKSPQTIDVQNDGNLIVRPVIIISGTANTLSLAINGESFSFGQISQPIEIDAEKYLVKVNGIEKLNAMTGNMKYLYLSPGNNKIRIDGSGLDLTMTIKFRNHYK